MCNPYQDVIDWLQSPEGEKWSENRLAVAKANYSAGQLSLTAYGDQELLIWKGILSIKRDDDPKHSAVYLHTPRRISVPC